MTPISSAIWLRRAIEDPQMQWCATEGWKELNTGSNDDEQGSVFHLCTKRYRSIES